MYSVAYTQGLRCTKCDRPTKGHDLPYGVNCTLAPIEKIMNNSRDILSGREDMPEVPCIHSQTVLGKPEDPMAEPAALETVVDTAEQTLPPTAPATMASPATTTPTITTVSIPSEVLTECALAALSTRLGQKGEERAKDKCHIKELSQELTETSDQLADIRKVLDHLLSGQTSAPMAAVVIPACSTASRSVPSSGSGCLQPGQAASFPSIGIPPLSQTSHFIDQSSTALGSAYTPISGNHISGQVASATHTAFLQASQDFQDHAQTVAFQGHSNDASLNHSSQASLFL